MATDLDFEAILEFSLVWEGGLSTDPDDEGGTTYRGITESNYRRFRTRKSLPLRPVSQATPSEIREIYYEDYWLRARCDVLPRPLAWAQFDGSVNLGVKSATILLQAVLGGLVLDGVLGPLTEKAARETTDPVTVAADAVTSRVGYYVGRVQARNRNEKFLRGWVGRAQALLNMVRKEGAGGVDI